MTIINAIVAIIGVTVGSLVSHHVTKAELQSKAMEEASRQCETYTAQMINSPERDTTTLEICPSGITYANASVGKEHFIPWRKVDNWRYSGLESPSATAEAKESHDLKINESTGFPFVEDRHDFRICCTATDVEKALETIKRHDARVDQANLNSVHSHQDPSHTSAEGVK